MGKLSHEDTAWVSAELAEYVAYFTFLLPLTRVSQVTCPSFFFCTIFFLLHLNGLFVLPVTGSG